MRHPEIRYRAVGFLMVAWIVSAVCAPWAWADSSLPAHSASDLTVESIRALLKEVEAAEKYDVALRTELTETYQQTLKDLEEAAQLVQEMQLWDTQRRDAASDLYRVERELTEARAARVTPPSDVAQVAWLEERLKNRAAALTQLQSELDGLHAEARRRIDRRTGAAAEIEAIRGRLDATAQQLTAPTDPLVPAVKAVADFLRLKARQRLLETRLLWMDKESVFVEATSALLTRRIELLTAQVAHAKAELQVWSTETDSRRQSDRERLRQQAETQVENVPPVLRQLAEECRLLAEESESLSTQFREVSQELREKNQRLERLRRAFRRTRDKVDAIGLTSAIGLLLQSERSNLSKEYGVYSRYRDLREAIRASQWRYLTLDDLRTEAAATRSNLDLVATRLNRPPDVIASMADEAAIDALAQDYRAKLDTVTGDCRMHFNALVDLDTAHRALAKVFEEYRNYLDERLLWTASADSLAATTLKDYREAASWFLSIENISGLASVLRRDVARFPWLWIAAFFLTVLIITTRRRTRARLSALGDQSRQAGLQRFLPTVEATAITVVLSLSGASIVLFLGWRVYASSGADVYARAIGYGIWLTAFVLWPIEFITHFCRRKGLAEAHFGWASEAVLSVRRVIRRGLYLTAPLLCVVHATFDQPNERIENTVGRLAFLGILAIVLACVQQLLRPRGIVFRYMAASGNEGPWFKFRHVWHAIGLTLPCVLALLAAAGFFYTAMRLLEQVYITVVFFSGLVMLGAFFARWILVIRRRLALQRARQRRETLPQSAAVSAAPGAAMPLISEPEPDLTAIGLQTRRLVRSFLLLGGALGAYFIWLDVFPALGFLDRIPLWRSTVEVTEWTIGADGQATPRTFNRPEVTSVADAGIALVVLIMTFIAARNIRGLFEIALPQGLLLDRGARYALTTISQYFITIAGIVAVLGMSGIKWSNVQWLVAAITVGLGFGLQEIFANFVSGLIILFERPIRVGDVVTIADVTGVVSRIRTRATTVTDWDQREFIVPNKEFVTGRLLNWTLTDTLSRIVINIGVSYQSDVELVTRILREITVEDPNVLDDPAPLITFEGFGDSALQFVVRCHVATLNRRLATTHALHTAIIKRFREAGIEIPFPQRDLHIRESKRTSPERADDHLSDAPPKGESSDSGPLT